MSTTLLPREDWQSWAMDQLDDVQLWHCGHLDCDEYDRTCRYCREERETTNLWNELKKLAVWIPCEVSGHDWLDPNRPGLPRWQAEICTCCGVERRRDRA